MATPGMVGCGFPLGPLGLNGFGWFDGLMEAFFIV
jgi:hypothetical protein